jgi:MoxR-like ATPase
MRLDPRRGSALRRERRAQLTAALLGAFKNSIDELRALASDYDVDGLAANLPGASASVGVVIRGLVDVSCDCGESIVESVARSARRRRPHNQELAAAVNETWPFAGGLDYACVDALVRQVRTAGISVEQLRRATGNVLGAVRPPLWDTCGPEPIEDLLEGLAQLGGHPLKLALVAHQLRTPKARPGSAMTVSEMETDFQPFLADNETRHMVNAALLLRRPLLVTGNPGTGKSRLAYAVAHELNLGPVLRWSINTSSTLRDGLYDYDAVGRLQATAPGADGTPVRASALGDFLTLGPLGTALLPWDRPRVVLVDEIDKSHVDLPNDLLHVFEDGQFPIRELLRADPAERSATVIGHGRVAIPDGVVRCSEFPLVIMSSNGEREFPAAFRRRCLELHVRPPSAERLGEIIAEHFSKGRFAAGLPDGWQRLCKEFVERRDRDALATDQLMNAIYLRACGVGKDPAWDQILASVWHALSDA